MRTAATTLALAAVGLAQPSDAILRSLARSERDVNEGLALVAASAKADSPAQRLTQLRRAKQRFRSARRIVHSSMPLADGRLRPLFLAAGRKATRGLVDVLDTETERHLARGRRSSANSSNNQARKLLPENPRTRALRTRLRQRRRMCGPTPTPAPRPPVTSGTVS